MDDDYKKKMLEIMDKAYKEREKNPIRYRNCYTKEEIKGEVVDKGYYYQNGLFNKLQRENNLMAAEDINIVEPDDISKLGNEIMQSIVIESCVEDLDEKEEDSPLNDGKNHYNYILDFSKKVGIGTGLFLTNHFLVSMGLPPYKLLYPLAVGTFNVAKFGVSATIGAKGPVIQALTIPGMAATIYKTPEYIKKTYKLLTNDDEDDIIKPEKSYTLSDCWKLVVNITYKTLKAIHDLF